MRVRHILGVFRVCLEATHDNGIPACNLCFGLSLNVALQVARVDCLWGGCREHPHPRFRDLLNAARDVLLSARLAFAFLESIPPPRETGPSDPNMGSRVLAG